MAYLDLICVWIALDIAKIEHWTDAELSALEHA